ncbi:MAG: sigma-70 family RNA polymerase sigma factor [Planctomycetia bacterium]|nr:sigma-70 family RNA polymerase sigma factor [Planctomycetia bacterium]
MPHDPHLPVLRHIRRLIGSPLPADLSDSQLVERFVVQLDETAFEALLGRYGPMVLGVCRRVLHHPLDVEDAFQAVFLVLARKARALARRELVGPWLYGVAYRIAIKARATTMQRRTRERQVADMTLIEPLYHETYNDLRPVIDEEVQHLPAKYRQPVVLCYMEGKTNEEAAAQLQCPSGTVKTRLAKGRDLLRNRLTRRGLALSAPALATALSEGLASAAVPVGLLDAAYQTALLGAAGKAGAVPAAVATLADGALHALVLAKVKSVATVCLIVALVIGGAGWVGYHALAALSAANPSVSEMARTVELPQDPQAAVLVWDQRRQDDLPGINDEPQLVIRADGSLVLTDPHGPGKRIETRLPPADLQDLLRFAIHNQGFFQLDKRQIPSAGRLTTTIHIVADGNDCRLQGADLVRYAMTSSAARQLLAIQQRLESLNTWLHAGEHAGVAAALRLANEQLGRQFPDAPLLTANDLHTALQRSDGTSEVVFERRGISADRDPFSFAYARIERPAQGEPRILVKANLVSTAGATVARKPKDEPLNVNPPPIAKDESVKYDYDIVYVRAPRKGDAQQIAWTEVFAPTRGEPGSDLMLLHPDGTEEVLVAAGDDAITDPFVSFDAESVYYSRFRNVKQPGSDRLACVSSDIFKIHVKTKKVVQLTHQEFTPNTGVVVKGLRSPGVHNLGPCPLPGGKVMFTSNRNGFAPTKAYTPTTLQLFVMDDDGSNVEMIGHLNINSALHPTIRKDGRVMFTSYESQGLRDLRLWALWTIHPDGTNWGPLFSAFGPSGDTAYHFMTQLSDGGIVVEEYYNLNNLGFGTYFKLAADAPDGQPYFGPAARQSTRNLPYNGSELNRIPFSPHKLEWLTTFCTAFDSPARTADPKNPDSPRVGKVTHPSGAPDNHLLTVWSPGPVNSNNGIKVPAIDGGIYLIKSGKAIDEPGQMLLIKNDPNYNEQWPRALVPYQRIHGVPEPKTLPTSRNDGKQSPHLPEGTPYGLVGTSSLYKRESYPQGMVPDGKVTALPGAGSDPFQGQGTLAYTGINGHWFVQGAEAGKYENADVHAIRILVTEPTTDTRHTGKRLWWNVANERLRILGEFPVRKFTSAGQPIDPDGHPDTSFLVKVPADVAWTFQTLDKHGMVLNMAQTWHQVRPGEIRTDCGGCHSHSQKPTHFKDTAAARPDYALFDLTGQTPLLTSKKHDQSGKKWDANDETGVRFEKTAKNVEYFRDVKPILDRSCVACHTQKADKPAGNLVLDDDQLTKAPDGIGGLVVGPPGKVPGTYLRLAMDHGGKFGHPSLVAGWSHPQASRYVRMFQARRSLLAWKIHGKRLDGWSNDDFAHETVPGDPQSLVFKGKPFTTTPQNRTLINLAFTGSVMPPPEAVAGTYEGPDGKKVKVEPLSDEDRLTLVRWIDLGCPIDLAFDPAQPAARGAGWLQDDNRPTLALTYPQPGISTQLTRILVGMHDYDSGLDMDSFQVVADFPVDGAAAGSNLAAKFKPTAQGVWDLPLATPLVDLPKGMLTVSVKDRQGNLTRIERSFSIRR